MNEHTTAIVAQARLCLQQRQFAAAAGYFEEAAKAEADPAGRADLLKQAGAAYLEDRSIKDAGRCYWQLSTLLQKQDKADTLMVYWRALILAIAGSRYDCNFEWKGEPGHHEDHLSHQREVEDHQREAERVLREVLRLEGVDPNAVLREAKAEFRRRQTDGGWGASECWQIIANASKT